jgi:hypothetical protein
MEQAGTTELQYLRLYRDLNINSEVYILRLSKATVGLSGLPSAWNYPTHKLPAAARSRQHNNRTKSTRCLTIWRLTATLVVVPHR